MGGHLLLESWFDLDRFLLPPYSPPKLHDWRRFNFNGCPFLSLCLSYLLWLPSHFSLSIVRFPGRFGFIALQSIISNSCFVSRRRASVSKSVFYVWYFDNLRFLVISNVNLMAPIWVLARIWWFWLLFFFASLVACKPPPPPYLERFGQIVMIGVVCERDWLFASLVANYWRQKIMCCDLALTVVTWMPGKMEGLVKLCAESLHVVLLGLCAR